MLIQFESYKKIGPNPFYIKHASNLLIDLYENGTANEISQSFNFCSSNDVVNLDKFMFDPKKKNLRSQSKSPTRISLDRKIRNVSSEMSKKNSKMSSDETINQINYVKVINSIKSIFIIKN